MALYAIGDTHLSFGTDKTMEIFDGWENYTDRLHDNWNKTVRSEDTVVVDGDISWGMTLEQAKEDFAFLHNLPGQKLLVKGNHDYWWDTKRKMDLFFEEQGFDSLHILHNNAYKVGDLVVCGSRGWFFDDESDHSEKVLNREAGRVRMSIEAGKKLGDNLVVFLHYPPITRSAACDEILNVLIDCKIKHCYYGHLHDKSTQLAFEGKHKGINFKLISSDHLNFTPYAITF